MAAWLAVVRGPGRNGLRYRLSAGRAPRGRLRAVVAAVAPRELRLVGLADLLAVPEVRRLLPRLPLLVPAARADEAPFDFTDPADVAAWAVLLNSCEELLRASAGGPRRAPRLPRGPAQSHVTTVVRLPPVSRRS